MEFFRRLWNYWNQIDGQVLLLLRPQNPRTQWQILSVFLLPKKVPLEVVMAKHPNSVYIETASECKLIKGESYTVDCLEGCKIQPQRAEFSLGCGPNYHPTFEIFLPYMLEEIYIMIRDQKDADVWMRRVVLTGETSHREQEPLSTE
ncbi:uncharacterized protein [Trachinotus anak]